MKNQVYSTFNEVIDAKKSHNFWIKKHGGSFQTGNNKSFYNKLPLDKYLSFDISNSAMQATCSVNGTINSLSVYRGNYSVEGSPGMWWYKDYSAAGSYRYTVKLNGENKSITDESLPLETSLLSNIFPYTSIRMQEADIGLLTFAPISKDGSFRPRAVIYGIMVTNTSNQIIDGEIALPACVPTGFDGVAGSGFFSARFTDTGDLSSKKTFSLKPGRSFWASTLFTLPGETDEIDIIFDKGDLFWFNETSSYYSSLFGSLSIPDDVFSQEFLQRMAQLSLSCINTDGKGGLIGCNTGVGSQLTSPYILLKDFFYYFLPFSILDSNFFKSGILWAFDHCLRPEGRVIPIERVNNEKGCSDTTEGGVAHSLSIALMAVVMCGLYYKSTADNSFFLKTPSLKEKITDILEKVTESRKFDDIWLFPSEFISDFPAYGDFHTGSNIQAWYAFSEASRIMRFAYKDSSKSKKYLDISNKIKKDLLKFNVIDGPFGKQFIEGGDADGNVPVMGHEGEESDTTLIPFFGFMRYDDEIYKNYTNFSMSTYNDFYNPIGRGISPGVPGWGLAISGHITGLANVVDKNSMYGDEGYMTEICKMTDFDGSLWWWPYGFNPEKYGEILRCRKDLAAKSGWAAGVYSALFISQFLGIDYDAPSSVFRFTPFMPSGSFSWLGMKYGSGMFDIKYTRSENEISIYFENNNNKTVKLIVEAPLSGNNEVTGFTVDDIPAAFEESSFLSMKSVCFKKNIEHGRDITILIKRG